MAAATAEIPIPYVISGFGVILALVGVIYRSQTNSIASNKSEASAALESVKAEVKELKKDAFAAVNSIRGDIKTVREEIKELDDQTPDKDSCLLCSQLSEEKFHNIHHRIDEIKAQNKENHTALVQSLTMLHKSVNQINVCVSKLYSSHDFPECKECSWPPSGGDLPT